MTKLEHFDQSYSAIRQSAWTERKSREAYQASLDSVEASRRLLDQLRDTVSPQKAVSE